MPSNIKKKKKPIPPEEINTDQPEKHQKHTLKKIKSNISYCSFITVFMLFFILTINND